MLSASVSHHAALGFSCSAPYAVQSNRFEGARDTWSRRGFYRVSGQSQLESQSADSRDSVSKPGR